MSNQMNVRINVFAVTETNPEMGNMFMIEGQFGDSMLSLIRYGLRQYPYEKVRELAEDDLILNINGQHVMGDLQVTFADAHAKIKILKYVEYLPEDEDEENDEGVVSEGQDVVSENEDNPHLVQYIHLP